MEYFGLWLLINIECLVRLFEKKLHALSWYRRLLMLYGLVAAVGGTRQPERRASRGSHVAPEMLLEAVREQRPQRSLVTPRSDCCIQAGDFQRLAV